MRSFAFVLLLAACSGDTPANFDADPRGPTCMGAPYDSCVTEHDCPTTAAPLCRALGSGSAAIQVCTIACTAGGTDTCPTGGTCNANGLCEPAAANHCHL